MSRVAAVLIILVLCLGCYAAAAQSESNSPGKKVENGPAWDWMAVYPIYSYNGLISPYYYPAYSYAWRGVQPAYYYPAYLSRRYPTSPWWIGEHWDLGKTMQIARYGSSIRVYSPGGWQTV